MLSAKTAKAHSKTAQSPARGLARQSFSLAARPFAAEAPLQEAEHAQAPAGPAWDFGKIALFPPERGHKYPAQVPLLGRSSISAETTAVANAIRQAAVENHAATPTQKAFSVAMSEAHIRDDASADRSARLLGAHAVTFGNQILFRRDHYKPSTEGGRALIAHELTHVAHQRQTARPRPQRFVGGDVLSVQVTQAMADAMTDDELAQQIQLLRSHLQDQPDDSGAAENLTILENEVRSRQAAAQTPAAPAPTSAAPAEATSTPAASATSPPVMSTSAPGVQTTDPNAAKPAPIGGVDVLSSTVTQATADAMSDDELSQQIQLLRSHLLNEPDDAGAAENLATLESVVRSRQTAVQVPLAPAEGTGADRSYLDQQFRGWVAEGNWPLAAEALQEFNNDDDILARLAPPEITQDQIAKLHQGALDNPRVGPQSRVALLIPPERSLPPGTSLPMGGDLDEYKSNPDYIDNFEIPNYDPSSNTLHLFFQDEGEAVLLLPLGRGSTNTIVLAFERKSLLYNPGPNDQKIYPTIEDKRTLPNIAQWLADHAEENQQSDLVWRAGVGALQARSLPPNLWWLALLAPASGLGARFLSARMRPRFGTLEPEPGETPIIRTPTPKAGGPSTAPAINENTPTMAPPTGEPVQAPGQGIPSVGVESVPPPKSYVNLNSDPKAGEFDLGAWLDEEAQSGRLGLIKRVRGVPEAPGPGGNPDYHLFFSDLENAELENLSTGPDLRGDAVIAESKNIDNIISNAIGNKSGRQADVIFIEVGTRGQSAQITDEAITAWKLKDLSGMSPNLRRLVVIRNSGGARNSVLDLEIR
jgi:ribosomal protein S15P/S13E